MMISNKALKKTPGAVLVSLLLYASVAVWSIFLPAGVTPGYAGGSAPLPATYTNSIGMQFVLIQAGTFNMGSNDHKAGAQYDEAPAHRVTITKPFYLGKFEVTQRQWVEIMGTNDSEFKRNDNPVDRVSWEEAMTFIRKLNERENTDKYRLPTEAEWEYAARADTKGEYVWAEKEHLVHYAWITANANGRTHAVGSKLPNPWGLYDMFGNVEEWVQDWYDHEYYMKSPANDPRGPGTGEYKSLRGGSWASDFEFCRSAKRAYDLPNKPFSVVGFRVAVSAN